MKTVILKDGAGNAQGVIREVAGGNQRLYDRSRDQHSHIPAQCRFHFTTIMESASAAETTLPGWRMTKISFPQADFAPATQHFGRRGHCFPLLNVSKMPIRSVALAPEPKLLHIF